MSQQLQLDRVKECGELYHLQSVKLPFYEFPLESLVGILKMNSYIRCSSTEYLSPWKICRWLQTADEINLFQDWCLVSMICTKVSRETSSLRTFGALLKDWDIRLLTNIKSISGWLASIYRTWQEHPEFRFHPWIKYFDTRIESWLRCRQDSAGNSNWRRSLRSCRGCCSRAVASSPPTSSLCWPGRRCCREWRRGCHNMWRESRAGASWPMTTTLSPRWRWSERRG